MPLSIRVALLESQTLVRELLAARLRSAGLDVIAAEDRPEQLGDALARERVDVVVLCVRAAPGSVELIRTLKQRHPAVRQLIIAPDPESVFLESARAAGASQVLCRRLHGPSEVLRAVRTLARGGSRAHRPYGLEGLSVHGMLPV
jgi:DNA-binding NarL/FixJ family response regulator